MLELSEAYEERPIRFLELWAEAGWRVKVYGIAYRRAAPRAELLEAARRVARERLFALAPDKGGRYGVGFVGAHDGRGVNFVFVDWWADENELHHHVYVSPPERPAELQETTATGLIACVWDLRVLAFEREAWLAEVLRNPSGPDLEGYLSRCLNENA